MCDRGDCNDFGHVYRDGVCVMCGEREQKEAKMKLANLLKLIVVALMLIGLLGVGVVGAQVDVESIVRVAEAEIASLDYEVVIVFDAKTGTEIFRKNGGSDGIWLSRNEALRAKNAIVTHNHPAGTLHFSLNDLQLAEWSNVRQLRIVTPDLRRCVVTRPANTSAWRGAFLYNDANYTALVQRFGGEREYQADVFKRWGWGFGC